MKVTGGNNPYGHQQQQRANGKNKSFKDMFAEMAANKSGEAGAQAPTSATAKASSNVSDIVKSSALMTYQEEALPELVKSDPTEFVYKPSIPEPKYPKSIYDLSPSELEEAKLGATLACRGLDKEKLSKGELYREIETIFQNYLGKDFKEPSTVYGGIMGGGEPGSHMRNLISANHFFEGEISLAGINIGNNPEILIQARGYTGMTESEIRAVVRAQYPEPMTIKDCILMAEELWKLDLEDINYGYCIQQHICSTVGLDNRMDATQIKKIYDTILKMPTDFDTIKTSYAAFAKDDYTSYPTYNMDNVFSSLLSWFGGFELCSPDMLNQLREMLDKMEKEGIIGFDEYGHCRSMENINNQI